MTNHTFHIRSPAKAWHIGGTLAAIAIPFCIGLYHLWPHILFLEPACLIKSGDGCEVLRRYARRHPIRFPVCFTFIFGSVLAGFIGSHYVKKTPDKPRTLFRFGLIGLQSATIAQVICAVIYILFVSTGLGPDGPDLPEHLAIIAVFAFFIAIVQLFLWTFITMPLSVLCGMIYGAVAACSLKHTGRLKPDAGSGTEI